MIRCTKLIEDKCTDDAARLEVGEFPSAGVCGVCHRYEGAPRGAGDIIHLIAKATGVAAVVEKATGGDCGCAKRRAALNAAIPFPDKPKEG